MSQALTTTDAKRTISTLIQSPAVREQVAMAIPKFLTPERMQRICLTTINNNPKLLECTPESLLASIMRAAQMGIEPDGRNGHLIPRWNSQKGVNECTFMPDYKGMIALVRKNGDVSDIYADLVCEADRFEIKKGLHRDLVHEIDIRKPRGPVLGAYAVIQYKDGGASFEFMTKEEIEAIRARSQAKASGPWVTDFGEMAKKTVLKRLLKLADLSPDTAERVAVDIESEREPLPAPVERPRFEAPAQIEDRPAETAPETPAPEKPKAARVAVKPAKAQPAPEPEKKPAPKPEAPPAPASGLPADVSRILDSGEYATLADKLTALLMAEGYTEAEFLTVARDNGWAMPEVKTLAEIEADLPNFISDWETAREVLAASRKEGAQ